MSKRFIVLLVAALALVLASTASATITISQAPPGPGYQNLSPWGGSVCGGHSGTYSAAAGEPQIRLGFGWFATTQGGLKQFFMNTHGKVDLTDGTATLHDEWSSNQQGTPFVTQQNIKWTKGEASTGTSPGGATVTGWSTWYRAFLGLTPGSYTLTVYFVFEKDTWDGWYYYPTGYSLGNTCTFTVTA